ncbi:hypothetical protein M8J76_008442 [Diaphorina citri]|nr:hypothetical protein M8J76_008442 [Diaphorina citri]
MVLIREGIEDRSKHQLSSRDAIVNGYQNSRVPAGAVAPCTCPENSRESPRASKISRLFGDKNYSFYGRMRPYMEPPKRRGHAPKSAALSL